MSRLLPLISVLTAHIFATVLSPAQAAFSTTTAPLDISVQRAVDDGFSATFPVGRMGCAIAFPGSVSILIFPHCPAASLAATAVRIAGSRSAVRLGGPRAPYSRGCSALTRRQPDHGGHKDRSHASPHLPAVPHCRKPLSRQPRSPSRSSGM